MSEALPAQRRGSPLRWFPRIDWLFLAVGMLLTYVLFGVLLFLFSWLFIDPLASTGQKDVVRSADATSTVFSAAELGALLFGAFATGFLACRGRGLATAAALGAITAVPFVIGELLLAPLVLAMAVLVGWVAAELRGLRAAGKAA